MAHNLMGNDSKLDCSDHVIWSTAGLWWGSPQWVIDAFKRFQISDELCEKHGYTKITKQDKANIFGLNAAKLYGVDVDQKRKEIPQDGINKFKLKYQAMGGQPSNRVPGWVRDDTRPARA